MEDTDIRSYNYNHQAFFLEECQKYTWEKSKLLFETVLRKMDVYTQKDRTSSLPLT